MKKYQIEQVSDAFIARNDPDISAIDRDCMEINGKHYCSSDNFMICAADGFILLAQGFPGVGTITRLTPEGARSLAAKMIEAADEQHAEATAKSNAALAAALAKKGPHT